MKKLLSFMLSVLLLVAVLTGCNSKNAGVPASTNMPEASTSNAKGFALKDDAKLDIKGAGIDLPLTAEDMLAREMETRTCKTVNSAGEVTETTITGFSLNKLLEENGVNIADVASINFGASDGYTMSAPADVYAQSEVYIILNQDGDNLSYPRSAIPEQRTMYWVRDLIKIELTTGSEAASIEAVVGHISIFREAVTQMEGEKLNNRGFEVNSFSMQKYFEKFMSAVPTAPVTMKALDGFEKTETAEIFLTNYVTLEAETGTEGNLPLYFSETISDGMRVKQLDAVISGSDAIYFGHEISVPELFKLVGMGEADTYDFIASDGFTTQIPKAALEFGKIYLDETEGFVRASFEGFDFGDAKGGGKVKYLMSIDATGVQQAQNASAPADTKALITCEVGGKTAALTEAEFLALPQIEKELSRTNSKGVTVKGVYKGVHWKDLAAALGADANSTVKLIASDNFEAVLTSDILNDPDSLFALYQDGSYIKSEGDGRIWFCASENFTANNWAKYIVKIVID